jgi:two-component system, NtrC family, response regulator
MGFKRRRYAVAQILVIDDEEPIREILTARMEALSHEVFTAATLEQGLSIIEQQALDLVFLDVNLPDGNGLDALPAIKQNCSEPEVIIITAMGSGQGAEIAINNGAWDYIEKPFYKQTLILQINQALEYRKAKHKISAPRLFQPAGIIGKSFVMKKCLEQAAQCAPSHTNVLVQGESGTGKELFARAIHDHSSVSNAAYIIVDCAAMPDTLMESLLFGHEKGAFTGADRASDGLIKMADKGTLFLDEIGELPLAAQKTFLRVLQEKKFRPVGSTRESASDFRLIAATNRDLEKMAAAGTFRKDLLYRVQTIVISLPPLRQRKEDIHDLALHHTGELCRKHKIPRKVLLPETLDILENHDWPGNVRELINVLEKTLICDPQISLVYPMHLPDYIRVAHVKKGLHQGAASSRQVDAGHLLENFKTFKEKALEKTEKHYFSMLLSHHAWDLDQAAAQSKLSKNRLYYFMRKYQLQKP